MRDPNLMILAAGISSRMKKATAVSIDPALVRDADSKTKSMIGLGHNGRPFLDYLLYNAREAGYRDVVLVVGERDQAIRDHYGVRDQGNQFHGLTIGYAVQGIPEGRTKPLGTSDAVLAGFRARPDWDQQQVTVCNSDNLYSRNALVLLLNSGSECAVIDYDRKALGFPPERTQAFAVLYKAGDGTLLDIIEKPTPADIERCADIHGRVGVNMNLFRFRSALIRPALEETPLHPLRNEKELPTSVTLMLRKHPGCLAAYPVSEEVPDLTAKEDICVVQDYLAKQYRTFSW